MTVKMKKRGNQGNMTGFKISQKKKQEQHKLQ